MADDTQDILALLQPWIQHYQVTLPNPIYLPSGLADAIKRLPPDFVLAAQDKKLELDQIQICIANFLCLAAIYQENRDLFLKAKQTDQAELFLEQELKASKASYQSAVIWQEQMLQLQQKLEIAIQAHMDQLQVLLQQHERLFHKITELHQDIVGMHDEVQQLQEKIKGNAEAIGGLVLVHDAHVEQVVSMRSERQILQQEIDAHPQDSQNDPQRIAALVKQVVLIDKKLVHAEHEIKEIAGKIGENKAQQERHHEKALTIIENMKPKQQALQTAATEWVRVGRKVQQASAVLEAFAAAIPDQRRREVFSNFKNIVTEANLNMKMEKAVECMRHSEEMKNDAAQYQAVLLSKVELAASSLVKNSTGTRAASAEGSPAAIVFSPSVNAAMTAFTKKLAAAPAPSVGPEDTSKPGPKI